MLFQTAPQLGVGSEGQAGPPRDYHVHRRQLMLVLAKTFADHAAHAIALDRIAGMFDRHRHAEAGTGQLVGTRQHDQAVIAGAHGPLENATKLARLAQPDPGRKGRRAQIRPTL